VQAAAHRLAPALDHAAATAGPAVLLGPAADRLGHDLGRGRRRLAAAGAALASSASAMRDEAARIEAAAARAAAAAAAAGIV
jgi:hypothetical protein